VSLKSTPGTEECSFRPNSRTIASHHSVWRCDLGDQKHRDHQKLPPGCFTAHIPAHVILHNSPSNARVALVANNAMVDNIAMWTPFEAQAKCTEHIITRCQLCGIRCRHLHNGFIGVSASRDSDNSSALKRVLLLRNLSSEQRLQVCTPKRVSCAW
jgi:hypothetical protein